METAFAVEAVSVLTSDGRQYEFSVQVADNPDSWAQGLMGVTSMPEDKGMLFDYGRPLVAKFWMKNTLIPLDMLFFNPQRELIHVEHEATPGDLTSRGPDSEICYVLEINGGLAQELEITDGAILSAPQRQECLQ